MQFRLISPSRRNSVLVFYRIFCLQNYKIVNTVETLCLHYRDSYLIRWRLHAQATIYPEDVNKIIKKAKDSSALGYDRISYKFIARLHQLSPTTLPLLYNSLLIYNVYPADWKRAICVITPKKGKQSYLIPSAYRPISLLPCIAKIMEAILAKKIEKEPYYVEPYPLIIWEELNKHHLNPISNTLSSTRNTKTIAQISCFSSPLYGYTRGI
jgi:hypothetical protein